MAPADRVSSILDLPLDILVLVFPYLDPKSFLAFCSTCKAFQQNSIRLDPAYWSRATRSTFRLPNQPVVQHDGARWQKLFKRLLTQSRVFTWGATSYYRLGHSSRLTQLGNGPDNMHPYGRYRMYSRNSGCSFPLEMLHTRELGVIADMQCGGWSTTILTSKGSLHTVGVLDGMRRPSEDAHNGPRLLRFPVGFPYSTLLAAYEEPTIAIRQFSAGRYHVLGLSDSGRIWSWYAANKPALHVKFLNVDVTEASSGESSPAARPLYGRVKQVVAGWSCSSAYIYGTGIVVWSPVERDMGDNDEMDTMMVMENTEIPRTAYQRTKGAHRESEEDKALGQEVGCVLNYIMLENYVVFVTDLGKVFCAKFETNNRVDEILELSALRSKTNKPIDVQGSFRRLAIFRDGEVMTTNQDYLDACWNARGSSEENSNIEGLQRIPALQQNDVISVAFGDYHFLALHSTGKITAYGTELQSCGALGLGSETADEARARGIAFTGLNRDGKLLPHAYTNGRQVWFEKEKKLWLRFMAGPGRDPEESAERVRLFNSDTTVQGEVSEWFEQESRDWDKGLEPDSDDDGLGSHFALSVSAAGWHSGALVLVNQELADRIRERCIVIDSKTNRQDAEEHGEASGSSGLAPLLSQFADMGRWVLGLPSADQRAKTPQDFSQEMLSQALDPVSDSSSPGPGAKYVWADRSFPRLRLSDGREMPGIVEFDEWKFGRPEWQLDIDV